MPKTALARPPLVEDRLYTREEAAEVLNVTLRFVTRCVQERRIRYVRIGRMVRIPESALEDYLRTSNVPAIRYPRCREDSSELSARIAALAFTGSIALIGTFPMEAAIINSESSTQRSSEPVN
jgi:excisionase family DNA binding protein